MKLLLLPLIFSFFSSLLDLISSTHLKNKYSLQSNSLMKIIDPDYNRTFVEILLSRGYSVETHYVKTEDGYILKLFRIPSAKGSKTVNKKPCLLVHGLLDSSDAFVLHYEEKSYSYILANSGYDVWLGNNRGNKYSRNHTVLDPDRNSSYWNFTFEEMGKYDLPQMIEYILNYTNSKKLTYFGHSQGTIQIFAAASENNAYFADKLNGVIALGPVAKLGNLSSKLVYFLAKVGFDNMLKFVNVNEFLPNSTSLRELSAFVCEKMLYICDGIVGLMADSNPQDDDQDKLPIYLTHYPSGTSLKAFSHLLQSIRTDKFAKYDYGSDLNMIYYGKTTPEEYDLKKIKGMKFCLFVGKDDQMATITDSRWIRDQLSYNKNLYLYKEVDNMGHLTFFIPKNVDYFKEIKECLNEFEK